MLLLFLGWLGLLPEPWGVQRGRLPVAQQQLQPHQTKSMMIVITIHWTCYCQGGCGVVARLVGDSAERRPHTTFYNSRRRRDFMTVPGLAAPEKNDENYKVAAAAPPATTAGGWPIWFSEQEVNQVGDCSVYLYFCGAFRPTNNICENSLRRADWKKLPQQTKGEQFCCSSS